MNPLHLKVEQNKQVKQLWSGARDILKRSEQPHSGQLIGGSFLKKTLMEGDRKWKWMNERKKMQLFSSALFAIHGKIIEKVHQFSRHPASTGSGFNSGAASSTQSIMPGSGWQFQHVSIFGIKFTHPTYPPIKRSKCSCCDFNLLYRCIASMHQFASPFRGTAPNLEASLASGRCQQ